MRARAHDASDSPVAGSAGGSALVGDAGTGWRVARLAEIPPTFSSPEGEAAPLEVRDPCALERFRRFAEEHPDNDRRWHAVRRFFGIGAFGVNAVEASAGHALLVPHDEGPYGQEELYVVLEGRARFRLDGDETEVGPLGLVFVRPAVHRSATALETPTVLLLVGGVPGRAYAPPAWSSDWRPQPAAT